VRPGPAHLNLAAPTAPPQQPIPQQTPPHLPPAWQPHRPTSSSEPDPPAASRPGAAPKRPRNQGHHQQDASPPASEALPTPASLSLADLQQRFEQLKRAANRYAGETGHSVALFSVGGVLDAGLQVNARGWRGCVLGPRGWRRAGRELCADCCTCAGARALAPLHPLPPPPPWQDTPLEGSSEVAGELYVQGMPEPWLKCAVLKYG
jgi:hypothetical protein